MNLIAIIVSLLALGAGIGFGYYLRLIISLGKKGSMELEIKQMMLRAKEEAQELVDISKKKTEEKMNEIHLDWRNAEASSPGRIACI